jgi:hypothetical protein
MKKAWGGGLLEEHKSNKASRLTRLIYDSEWLLGSFLTDPRLDQPTSGVHFLAGSRTVSYPGPAVPIFSDTRSGPASSPSTLLDRPRGDRVRRSSIFFPPTLTFDDLCREHAFARTVDPCHKLGLRQTIAGLSSQRPWGLRLSTSRAQWRRLVWS